MGIGIASILSFFLLFHSLALVLCLSPASPLNSRASDPLPREQHVVDPLSLNPYVCPNTKPTFFTESVSTMASFAEPLLSTGDSHLPPTPPSELATTADPAKMTSHPATTAPAHTTSREPETKHIWVITGPAGCGKTSVAEHLHTTYGMPYLEGDTYHTPANVEKMRTGQPLTDADRWDWLILLREEALSTLLAPPTTTAPDTTTPPSNGVIVTCSALKRKYRDVLRVAAYHHPDVQVHFVFLAASEALLMDRVRARQGHYMKDYMVRSQFQSLETPLQDERDVLSVDAGGTSVEVQELAGSVVGRVMGVDAGS